MICSATTPTAYVFPSCKGPRPSGISNIVGSIQAAVNNKPQIAAIVARSSRLIVGRHQMPSRVGGEYVGLCRSSPAERSQLPKGKIQSQPQQIRVNRECHPPVSTDADLRVAQSSEQRSIVQVTGSDMITAIVDQDDQPQLRMPTNSFVVAGY